jgi:hypothetical protein
MNAVLAVIGRRAQALGLELPDASVSGCHLSVLRTPLGIWVFDLLSDGGIQLNRRRVRWGKLSDGDELQVGIFRFRATITPPHPRSIAPTDVPAAPERHQFPSLVKPQTGNPLTTAHADAGHHVTTAEMQISMYAKIAAMQRERKSGWQRFLDLFRGR